MDMKEEKEKKIQEQFKKTYLDTVKHAKDIEKWVNSGKRKQGDIRRSIQRLDLKYHKLVELKNMMINEKQNEGMVISDPEIYNKDGLITLNQIEEKINELYILSGLKSKNDNKSKTKYNNIELVTDIPGNKDGLYYLEKRKGFINRKNKPHRRILLSIKEAVIDKYYDIKHRLSLRKKEKTNQNKNDKVINEYEQYCMEMQKGPFKRKIEKFASRFSNLRKNKIEKNNKYKKVGRAAAFLMAGTLMFSGGITVGESNTKSDDQKGKEPTNTYVDINNNQNEFKNSIYIQALQEESKAIKNEQPTTEEIATQKETQTVEKEQINKLDKNSNQKEKKENNQNNIKEQSESSDDLYNVKANTKYTEVSDGSGNFGFFDKATKVKIYNRALLKIDENGNKSVLNVSNVGQTWEQFAKENNINYEEFREYIDNNPNIQEMVSIQSEDGKTLYGWLSKDKLEKVEELER